MPTCVRCGRLIERGNYCKNHGWSVIRVLGHSNDPGLIGHAGSTRVGIEVGSPAEEHPSRLSRSKRGLRRMVPLRKRPGAVINPDKQMGGLSKNDPQRISPRSSFGEFG